MGAKSTGGRVGLLGFLNGRQRCRYGSKLIGGCGSHCQAWWKPNPAMSNFTNIAAGGTCWTCLLSALQMVGNVPDLLTPSGGPRQLGHLNQSNPHWLPCVCKRMYVHECAFVAVFVYKLPHGHLSFPLSCYIFHLHHTRFPQSLQWGSVQLTRNFQLKSPVWTPFPIHFYTQTHLIQTVQLPFLQSLHSDLCHSCGSAVEEINHTTTWYKHVSIQAWGGVTRSRATTEICQDNGLCKIDRHKLNHKPFFTHEPWFISSVANF